MAPTSTSLRSQPQRWDSSQSVPTSSQSSSSKPRRSPNRIKARPANPQVISSILSSFDALETHRSLPAPEQFSRDSSRSGRKGSKGSSTREPDSSFASAPDIPFAHTSMPYPTSPGFGMHYGSTVALDEADDDSDAALPPTIPTTRSTSAFSHQSTRKSALPNGSASLRPQSLASRRSSSQSVYKEKEKDRGMQHSSSRNLSAESWIKQNIQQSLETAQAPKGLVRVPSQETLRPQDLRRGREHLVDYARGYATAGASEPERIAHDSPVSEVRPDSKGRLYLDPSDEDESSPTKEAVSPQSEVLDSPVSPMRASQSSSPNAPVSSRASPSKANIADSIPLRTSSLRQSSSSPAPMKRKTKKAQRQIISDSPFVSKRTEPISDTSFLDLGEDDETVKRILELRKRRETRLLESTPAITAPADLNLDAPQARGVSPSALSARIKTQEIKPPSRPPVQRINSAPVKAHKMLGLTIEPPTPKLLTSSPSDVSRSARASPEFVRSPASPLSTSNLSQPYSESISPQLSLDYSYAQAVDALRHTGSNDVRISESDRPSIDAAIPKSIALKRESLTVPAQLDARSESSISYNSQHIKRKGKKNPQNRWTAIEHPDLPPEFVDKRRSRRKSMNDAARNAMIHEEELAVQRRDSIEDAVLGFLCAARLNQRIQHNGRTISFSEVGDPDGAAVFVCVGMGLTRFVTAFYDELATTLRLRLVTIERPGVGGSEPYPQNDRSGPMNWPNDVLLVCEHLKIAKFSLLAHSAGAIYALATALVLPHLVQGKVQLMAPWIPPSQLEAVAHSATSTPPAGALPTSQRLLRILPTPFLRAANSSFMTAASSSLKPATKRRSSGTSPRQEIRANSESPARGRPVQRPSTSGGERPDFHRRESMMMMDQYMPSVNPMENFPIPIREVMEEEDTAASMGVMLSATATPTDADFTFASTALNAAEHAERERQVEYTSRLTQRTWEYAIRDSNPATDLLVCLERHREVGFRYTDVNRPVVITHGSEDKRVPVGNIRWLAEQMNRNALGGYRGGSSGLHPVRTRDTYRTDFESVGGGGCEVRVLPGEGHGLMASPLIMGDILTEIAGYWREPLML